MTDVSDLENMGRELKCPICLSLLDCSVSLSCNHVFCNSCIDKSMKSASDCPVCKVPYRRREIRPAPHMDNLVRIYKNMEASSGINIFVSQTTAPVNLSGDKTQLNKDSEKICKKKGSESCKGKPSFPAKKRVQVQKYPPLETPKRPKKSELETKKDEKSSEIQKEKPIIIGEPVFTPFFWLRDEEDIQESSQHTDLDHSPIDPPNFSDIIKDSDDVSIDHKSTDMFDSEMFEWTQKPCSPELYSSPIKLQVEDSEEIDELKGGTIEIVLNEGLNTILPSLSSPEKKKKTKRSGKAMKSTQNKRVKTSITEITETIETHKDSSDKELSDTCPSLKKKRKSCKKSSQKLKAKEDEVKVITNQDSPNPTLKTLRDEIKETSNSAKKNQKSMFSKAKDNSDIENSILRKCDNNSSKITCAFCRSCEESEVSGVMIHYLKGKPVNDYDIRDLNVIHAHKNCTEWAPNVYFEEDNNVINLESELARSKRIKCCLCGIKGAALGCYEKTCRKSFHVPCANLTPQCRWDYDNFVALCPLHASSKLPCEIQGFQTESKRVNLSLTPQKKNKDMIICCSALTNEEKGLVSEFEKLFGVTILKNFDSSVTHVIASSDENGACRRTLKFLMGVIEGKWVLNIKWIKDCIMSKELINEQNYEIQVDIHGIKNGPKLGRLRVMNQEPKLFSGCKFYLMGDFVASYKGYLNDLVIASGGTILNRKPISGEKDSKIFVIYSVELPEKCDPSKVNLILNRRKSDAEALASFTGAFAVTNSWILHSIAGSKLLKYKE